MIERGIRPFIAICLLLVATACLSATTATGDPTVASVKAAHKEERWREAADGARTVLDAARAGRLELGKLDAAWMHFIESEAAFRLDEPEPALEAANACESLLDSKWKGIEGWRRSVALARGFPLLRMGRAGEAVAALDALCALHPSEAGHGRVVDLRALASAREPFTVVLAPGGTLQEDPRLSEGVETARELLPAAAAALRDRIGPPALALPRMVLCIHEGASEEAWALTSAWRSGEGWLGLVRVHPSRVASGRVLSVPVLAHEMLHAARHLNGWFVSSPAWIEEGLAHWAEAAGEDRLWERLLSHVTYDRGVGGVPGALEGLASRAPWDGRPDAEQAILGWLLFRHLEKTRGRESVRAFLQAAAGPSDKLEGPFREAFGVGLDEAREEIRKVLPAWAKDALDGLDELPDLGSLATGHDEDGFDAAFAKFVKARPASRLLPHVRLATVRWRIERRRLVGAAALLREARGVLEGQIEWRPRIAACEVELAAARGDDAATVRLGRQALHVDPDLDGPLRDGIQARLDAAEARLKESTPPPQGPERPDEDR